MSFFQLRKKVFQNGFSKLHLKDLNYYNNSYHEIIDDYSFSVTYEQPFAPILESWCIGIIPEHIYKNEDINTSQYNRNPIGTGPYKFKK